MKFFVATKNPHKLEELKRILTPLKIDAVSEQDIEGTLPQAEETGATFEENALIKARAGKEFSGLSAIADDSGLCVDALSGAPGVYSARFAGTTEENNKKLLELLKDVPREKRTARFVSVVACVFADGREFTVRGECEGYIAFEAKGNGGFGYDPLFESEIGRFSMLTPAQKDSVSHRGKSLAKLSERLKQELELKAPQNTLTSKERAAFRAQANNLQPSVHIGKGGVTPQVITQTGIELDSKDLIKCQVLETSPVDAKQAANIIAVALGADVVQVIGRKFVLYREIPEEKKKKPDKKKKTLKGTQRKPAAKTRRGKAAERPGFKKYAPKGNTAKKR